MSSKFEVVGLPSTGKPAVQAMAALLRSIAAGQEEAARQHPDFERLMEAAQRSMTGVDIAGMIARGEAKRLA